MNTRAQPAPAAAPPPPATTTTATATTSATATTAAVSEPEAPQEAEPKGKDWGPFAKGSKRLSLLVGTGYTGGDNYFILGGGLGFFVVNGLELGLDYEAWIGGDPFIHRLSPGAKFVLGFVPRIKPYVGIFYRRTMVANYDDFSQWGARVGAFYAPPRGRVFVGGGAVYERLFDCDDSGVVDCDSWYPEVMVGISL